MNSLKQWLQKTPYAAYSYSYPHKTAYRKLSPPFALQDVWQSENREALFLYLHVPFCEMRCGFCNLFTTVRHDDEMEKPYLAALEIQARQVREAIAPAQFAGLAIGGGTPTFLSAAGLHRLFDIAEEIMGARPLDIPVSVETSPLTATPEKLQILKSRGANRISIGVQSFVESEVRAGGRAQKTDDVLAALNAIRDANFSTLNIDLILGLPGQTTESLQVSLYAALQFRPEEIFLYPLYVRPLTGLGKRAQNGKIEVENLARRDLYRAGRDFLLENGYHQISLRQFQKTLPPRGHPPALPLTKGKGECGPVYCCQQDGMIGLGAGARSYSSTLHYSGEYAVGATGVREILHNYMARPAVSFDYADYGFQLNEEEQKRRYIIQSLGHVEGLNFVAYADYFGSEAMAEFPQLRELEELGLMQNDGTGLRPTSAGLENADVIGPWLASHQVRSQMETFALR
ncbi:MAG TPA: STM4012 family radical SAM protein [Abditibacteriaceae bacterium]|jgi:oxygen-independent coproporphyrinogen-3 oxidase